MDITLIPSKLNGTIQAQLNVTNSLLHAVCQALALHQVRIGAASPAGANASLAADFIHRKDLWSEDTEAIISCFRVLANDAPTLHVGNNSRAFCMMLPIAAAAKHKVSFTGTTEFPTSLILPMVEVLKRRDVRFSRGSLKFKRKERDKLLEICTLSGQAEYGGFSLTGREDPYFLTGLLLGLPLLPGNSSVRMTTMPDSMEMPEMAVAVMRQYGITVMDSVDDYGYPYFEIPGNQHYRIPDDFSIEGDWARASFWLGCGALGGNVTVRGLSGDSSQTARQILDKLRSLGAATGLGADSAGVVSGSLQGCNINASRIPGLIPILAVLMANASGTSMLTGINCDDHMSVFRVLDAFGADISNGGSGFSFTGTPILTGGEIDAGGDPVIVMVATAASCFSRMPVTIRGAGVINKLYPGFFDEYAALGGQIEGR